MKIQPVAVATAILLAAAGLSLLFVPAEIGALYGIAATAASRALLQTFGAALLGMAAMNWTARFSLVGGLHGRAIGIANFSHFGIGLAALLRAFTRSGSAVLAISAAAYGVAAVVHAVAFFRAPKSGA